MARKKIHDDDELPEEEAELPIPEDSEDRPARPKPGVTPLTLILCVLNVLAAGGFLFLLAMDLSKRQAWSHAVFMHDLALQGVPLDEEAKGPSASQITFPRQTVGAEELKNAMSQRAVKGSEGVLPATFTVTAIKPEDLTPETLNDWFKGIEGGPVKTLDEEIGRVKKELPEKIAAAAQEVAASVKTEADQRALLQQYLLNMAYTIYQVQDVAKKVKDLPAAQLNDKLVDAAQRRLLIDILVPLDASRPAEVSDRTLQQVSQLDKLPLDRLQNLLLRRIDELLADKFEPTLHFGKDWADQTRDTVDRRHAIAYFLFTLSQVKKPNSNPPQTLYPVERVQAVVGLHQSALSAQALARALVGVQDRLLGALSADRDGGVFQGKDGPDRTAGFVDRYRDEVQRLRTLVSLLKLRQNRLDDLQLRIKGHTENRDDRAKQVKDVTKKIIEARTETARQMAELAKMTDRFFTAKRQLADAQEVNLRLERQIGIYEGLKRKGGATP
ncbi:MAG: hypothetical protein FJ271_23420 [Planctomycetes bacterium]|nr:hypothetical protein [Planctomycetota bacterium]